MKNSEGVMGSWGGKGAAECWSLKIFEIKN